MDDERFCDQCGCEQAVERVRRPFGPVVLCNRCLAVEEGLPEAPIAAAWDLEGAGLAIERVWPVAVNLHRFHLEEVVGHGIDAPAKLTTEAEPGGDGEGSPNA